MPQTCEMTRYILCSFCMFIQVFVIVCYCVYKHLSISGNQSPSVDCYMVYTVLGSSTDRSTPVRHWRHNTIPKQNTICDGSSHLRQQYSEPLPVYGHVLVSNIVCPPIFVQSYLENPDSLAHNKIKQRTNRNCFFSSNNKTPVGVNLLRHDS